MKTTWTITDVKNKSYGEILEIFDTYETELAQQKKEKLEYKRQLNTLKYKIKKLCE